MNKPETVKNLEERIEHNIYMHNTSMFDYDKEKYRGIVEGLARDYKVLTGDFYRRQPK